MCTLVNRWGSERVIYNLQDSFVFTELVSREQVGGTRVVMCIVGSSPAEFTLVDYPTMDELEID